MKLINDNMNKTNNIIGGAATFGCMGTYVTTKVQTTIITE